MGIAVIYKLSDVSKPATIVITDIYGRVVRQLKVVLQPETIVFRLRPGSLKAAGVCDNDFLSGINKSKQEAWWY